jgi:hypothetical protein
VWSIEGIFQKSICFKIICMRMYIHIVLICTCTKYCVLLTNCSINRITHRYLNKWAQLHLLPWHGADINGNVLYAILQYLTCHALWNCGLFPNVMKLLQMSSVPCKNRQGLGLSKDTECNRRAKIMRGYLKVRTCSQE